MIDSSHLLHLTAAAAVTLGAAASAQAGVIFSQDFSGSTTVSDYEDGVGDADDFTSISVDPNTTASVAISNDDLVYSFAPDTDPPPSGQGHFTHTAFGSPDLLSAQFTFTITNPENTNNTGARATLTLGSDTSGNIRNQIEFVVLSSGLKIRLRGGNGGVADFAVGSQASLTLYENDSLNSESFFGPDGLSHTIDADKTYLFVNNALIADNVTAFKTDRELVGMFFDVNINDARNLDNGTFAFDSIVVRDDLGVIPEPASLALMGVGGLVMLSRRR